MTTPCRERWSAEEIRQARMAPLAPLLARRKLTLIERGSGNFEVREHPRLLVKDSYWRWPERGLAGNSIDFFTKVEAMTYQNAMKFIAGK